MARIAIIGCGSMGEALLAGVLRAGREAKDVVVSERVFERADYLSRTYSVQVLPLHDALAGAEYVILAVKPGDVESVVAEIKRMAKPVKDQEIEQVATISANDKEIGRLIADAMKARSRHER